MPANKRPGARAPRKPAANRKPPTRAEPELDPGMITPAEPRGVVPETSEESSQTATPEASAIAPGPLDPEASAATLSTEPQAPPWAATADRPGKQGPRAAERPAPPWASPADRPSDPAAAWRARPDRAVLPIPPREAWATDRGVGEGFRRDLEPAWLRRRRAVRQAVPREEWTAPIAHAEASQPEIPRQIALTASEAALAALPLLIGLFLLWLGAGSGQLTFQT